jgi:hypothetical protein
MSRQDESRTLDNGPFLGARLILALREGDVETERHCREQLRRLGYRLTARRRPRPSAERQAADAR